MEPPSSPPTDAADLLLVLQGGFDLFAAEVAHEVVYPLQFMRFLLNAVQRGRATLDQELVELCTDEIQRLERLQADLARHLSPPGTPDRQSLVAAVRAALPGAGDGTAALWEIEIGPDLTVDVATADLRFLLYCLRQYCVAGSGETRPIQVTATAAALRIELRLTLTSAPIDRPASEVRFLRTELRSGGFWLAMAKRLARRMGGEVMVHSRHIEVTLPGPRFER